MKHTIRWKFTVTFISLIALSVGSIWCINNWFLEDYYQNYKVKILETGYYAMDDIVRREKMPGGETGGRIEEEMTDMVRELRDTSNITLLIYDSMKDQTLVSSTRDMEILRDRVRQYILGENESRSDILREYDNYMIQKTFDPRSKTFFLESWGFFSDNSTIFIMSTPLESIREGAQISNRFLMYVGLAVILVGSAVLYVMAKRFTDPLNRLSQLSEKMSNLDFDAKYVEEEHSTAEIDTLGNSMNVLSDRLRDTIGELKEANEQLQRDIEEKTQIDEMRKDFIANVSHELKTPIALIQGYAEGLVEGMAEEPENRDYYCGVIMDEAGKMNKLVKQLLTLTALEFGKEQTVMEVFDLTELIRGVISSAGLLLSQKEAEVEFACTEPVYVRADEFKIEEVVTNYLTNAINHADGERKISIRVERRETIPSGGGERLASGEGGMASGGDRPGIRVTVFNTGNPIPEADLPNLWTKFYKVDKARTRAYGGSGIGLSIVKAIMDSHHRPYGVRNCEDGVEFWFEVEAENLK